MAGMQRAPLLHPWVCTSKEDCDWFEEIQTSYSVFAQTSCKIHEAKYHVLEKVGKVFGEPNSWIMFIKDGLNVGSTPYKVLGYDSLFQNLTGGPEFRHELKYLTHCSPENVPKKEATAFVQQHHM